MFIFCCWTIGEKCQRENQGQGQQKISNHENDKERDNYSDRRQDGWDPKQGLSTVSKNVF